MWAKAGLAKAETNDRSTPKARWRMHKKADNKQEMIKMASRTTSVAAKPGDVMQMRPSVSERDGKTIVVVLSLDCSKAKVKSPVDTTWMIRLMPTSCCSDAGCSPTSRWLLGDRWMPSSSERGLAAAPILAYGFRGSGADAAAAYWTGAAASDPAHWSGHWLRQIWMVHWKWTSIESGNLKAFWNGRAGNINPIILKDQNLTNSFVFTWKCA